MLPHCGPLGFVHPLFPVLPPSPPILSPMVLASPSHSPYIHPFWPSHPILLSVEPKLVGTPSLDQPRLLKLDLDDRARDPDGPTLSTTQHHTRERPNSRVVMVKDVKAARADFLEPSFEAILVLPPQTVDDMNVWLLILLDRSLHVKDFINLHLPQLHICITSRPEFDIQGPGWTQALLIHKQHTCLHKHWENCYDYPEAHTWESCAQEDIEEEAAVCALVSAEDDSYVTEDEAYYVRQMVSNMITRGMLPDAGRKVITGRMRVT
ncbi:hypothetical protein EI94DRAFT_1805281 [Lactarius quietus]|nr:hypothetical protein EI94DRAFT_1805281 [Lactarius quietus]